MDHDEEPAAPVDFWEERYAGSGPVWSGRPNASVMAAIRPLTPGRALELGCGEGADAIWLAQQGWQVTAYDISLTAIERARRAAAESGLDTARVTFTASDLGTWTPAREFDLVTTAFFHSPVALPREEILRRAADAVRPGGHLLVVSHASAPPWASAGHDHSFPTPQDELTALGLPDPGWQVVRADVQKRAATAPDGTPSSIEDVVVLVQRK